MTSGIDFYKRVAYIEEHFDEEKEALSQRLYALTKKIFRPDNMMISYTADDTGYEALPRTVTLLSQKLPEGSGERYPFVHPVENKNEGLKTSSQVNYVARCGSFLPAGLSYHGALKILKVILSYDYLWIQVRVKGGAYGVMSGIGRSGEGYFVSYRDPNLRETNTVYENIVEYLENFDADERDMTKYVIGTISDLDAPLTPSLKGSRGLSAYLSGVTAGMLAEEREQVLDATPADIRALAPIVKAVLDTGSLCVIGNEDKVRAESGLFGEVKNLFNN